MLPSSRLLTLGALAAGLVLAGAGAVWFHHALDSAHDRGRALGRLQTSQELERSRESLRQASECALEQSNWEAANLAARNIQLQEKLDGLPHAIAANTGAGGVCLAVDVVRALAAIGARPAADQPRP